MKNYGKELILDIHKCDAVKFTRKHIQNYFKILCNLIDMKREDLHWWDFKGRPKEYAEAPPHLRGTSAVQFIQTSNITIHTLDDLKQIHMNIFSCKNFDEDTVAKFTSRWFKGTVVQMKVIDRI